MPANTPQLDAFIEALKPVAMQYGITTLVIGGVDPTTREAHVYGGSDSINALRVAVGEKFGFGNEVSWNDT